MGVAQAVAVPQSMLPNYICNACGQCMDVAPEGHHAQRWLVYHCGSVFVLTAVQYNHGLLFYSERSS